MKTKRILSMVMVFMLAFTYSGVTSFADTVPDWTNAAKNQIALQGDTLLYNSNGNSTTNINNAWVAVTKTIKDSKTDSSLSENEFEITLDVKTKEEIKECTTTETTTTYADSSVVLVVDLSGSMWRCSVCNAGNSGSVGGSHVSGCKFSGALKESDTRWYATKEAAKSFLQDYRDSAKGSNAKRLVSIVEFGSNATVRMNWTDVNPVNNNNSSSKYNTVYNSLDTMKAYTGVSSTYDNAGTNMEGGLMLARNLYISGSGYPFNSYSNINICDVILFSDGEPSFYMESSDSKSISGTLYGARGTSFDSSRNGWFLTNEHKGWIIDRAKEIKGISNMHTKHGNKACSLYTVAFGGDTTTSGGSNLTALHNWLKDNIASAGSGHAFYTNDPSALKSIFKTISDATVTKTTTTTTTNVTTAVAAALTDPMGSKYIIWNTGNAVSASRGLSFNNNTKTLTWNLASATPTSITSGTYKGWKQYTYTYKVTLDVMTASKESSAAAAEVFDSINGTAANGKTTLKYNVGSGNDKTVEFKVPRVFGYKADYGFIKTSDKGAALAGYKFDLKHNGATVATAISDANGLVSFTGIPSGYTFTLTEDQTVNPNPDLYLTNGEAYTLKTSYGEARVYDKDSKLSNKWLATGNFVFKNTALFHELTISKTLGEGDFTGNENFGFIIGFNELPADFEKPAGAVLSSKSIDGMSTVYEFALKGGQSIAFPGLTSRTSYIVEEDVPENCKTPVITVTAGSESNQVVGSSISGTAGGALSIEFKNHKHVVDMEVTKDADKTVYEGGDAVLYEITVKNTGTVLLTNVTLDERADFVGPYATDTDALNGENLLARDHEFSITAGGSITVYYTYSVPVETTEVKVDNTVTVTAKGGGETIERSADESVKIIHPALTVSKEVIGLDVLNDKETATYKVTVSNNGEATAKNVILRDFMVDDFGLTSASDATLVDSTLPSSIKDSFVVGSTKFDVPAGGSVEFIFAATVYGLSASDVQKLYAETKASLDQNVLDIEDAACDFMDSLNMGSFSGMDDAIEAINDRIDALYEEMDDPDADILMIEDEIDALFEALDAIEEFKDALEKAEAALADFEENGLASEELYNTVTNTAEIIYSVSRYVDVPSASVDVKVRPQESEGLTIYKEVRVADASGEWTDWSQLWSLPQGGGSAEYRITIENLGTKNVTVSFEDSLYPEENRSITIVAGDTHVFTYSKTIPANTGFETTDTHNNVASIAKVDGKETDGSLKSEATVTVPPQTYAKLDITKKVYTSAGWADSHKVSSNSIETFLYKVTVSNSGNETAYFTLSDSLLSSSATMYTDAELTTPATADDFILAPGADNTYYYTLNLSKSAENVATYTLSSGNKVKNEKDRSGSDDAYVEITPIPKSQLSIEKKVTTKSEFDGGNPAWRDSAEIRNVAGEGKFVFRIAVSNKTLLGTGYPITVSVTDVMDGYDFGDQLEGWDTITINADDTVYLFLDATITAPGVGVTRTHLNTATISMDSVTNVPDDVEVTLENGESTMSDTAQITVDKSPKPVINIGIKHQVKDSDGVWQDIEAHFIGTEADVTFRSILTATPGSDMGASDFTVNGSIDTVLTDRGLQDLENDGAFTLTRENPVYITEYTVNLPKGTHVSLATITDAQPEDGAAYDVSIFPASDDAKAIISEPDTPPPPAEEKPTTGGGGGGNKNNNKNKTTSSGGSGTDSKTTIPGIEVPLDNVLPVTPKDPIVILKEDVPLGDIPQTGVENMQFSLLMLSFSILSLLGLFIAGRRRVED